MEMLGIGFKIDVNAVIAALTFADTADNPPMVNAMMQLTVKPDKRSFRVRHVACNSLSKLLVEYDTVAVIDGNMKLEKTFSLATASQIIKAKATHRTL